MGKRSETRRGEEGDAVRVLAPDPDPRHARPVEMVSSTSPPSSVTALVVAAVVGVLGVAGFLVLMGDASVDETNPSAEIQPTAFTAPEPAVPGRTIDVTSSWVAGVGVAAGGEVADAVVGERRLVAAGAAGSRAAVWASTDGNTWAAAPYVETPSATTSRFDAIANGANGWIGIGTVDGQPAMWRAEEWENWDFLGLQSDLSDVDGIVDLTVGPGQQFWLVGHDAGGPMLWVSLDGVRWRERDPGFGPEEVDIKAAVASDGDDGWLYLAGSRCRVAVCRPAIWRTQDGFNWSAAETPAGLPGGELSDAPGGVTTMGVAANCIVAAGSTHDSGSEVPAVWISRDGVTWATSEEVASSFPAVTIRLQRVSETEPAIASLRVGNKRVDATVGDTLATEVGLVSLASVDPPHATLRFGGEEIELGTGSSAVLRVFRGIENVAVQADRIVAVGFESDRGHTDPALVTWTSDDGGSSWEMDRLPGGGDLPAFVGLSGRRLMAVSAGGGSWHRDWDGRAVAAAAKDVVTRLVVSLVNGDLPGAVAALPTTRSVRARDVELPGLTEIDVAWWNESSGYLDTSAVTGALAFVTELDTETSLFDCSATPLWNDRGQVRVNCSFRTSSDFHRAMGIAQDTGTLTALVEEGAVVSLTGADARTPWRELEQWARESDPGGAALAFGAESNGAVPPQVDAALAEAAMAWVARYRAAFLLPGDSVEVDTPVGSMIWSVIDPFDGQMLDAVVFARGAFWAIAADMDFDTESYNGVLWRSEDGMEWEVAGGLPTEDWWRAMAGGGRLFAAGGGGGELSLMLREWNGFGWTELDIAAPEAGEWWVQSIAESNGQILVLGEGWEPRSGRPLGGALWAQAPGGGFEVRAVDGPDFSTEASRSLIGMEAGFVLIVPSADWARPDTEVWGSPDGTTWELLTDEPGFEGGWLRWAGTVDGDLVLLAWGGDDCSVSSEPCQTVWQQWSSADGIDWELVGEVNRDGAMAGGPLGLVAIGQDDWWGASQSMSVLMADGSGQFVELADVGVRFPGADWAWPGDIAMSDDAIVVPIKGGFEVAYDDMNEESWLLVGRVLEP